MHFDIESIFDEAENRYLKSEELNSINQYVNSLPTRLEAYRTLRDKELEVMQRVADKLQAELPQEKIELLERSIKNALLILRYCAMGMLLNDETFVQTRLMGWLSGTMKVYNTQTIDTTLYRLLNQQLALALSPEQMNFLSPQVLKAQTLLQEQATSQASALGR